MKVTHHEEFDTHAVIGGKQVEEFAIAQTAEFFTVLSSTLYSNKPLAVVREVLCNAWDAHIVAGTTDRPVIITITDDKLSIRDFGLGIPHELIHGIYCIYGNSTKQNDGNQTGGFGLGSKAPFAYSDHFTVVNHHEGIKNLHAISRGSALTQGKPDRRVMVSVPTTETGVEVIIPVKSPQDKRIFIEIATEIAAFGEMNVQINGKQIQIVPISKAVNNMFLTKRTPQGVKSKIYIRYGNVVYPIQDQVEYSDEYNKLDKIIKSVSKASMYGYNYDSLYSLIMQAPSNSISVTPSRESLSNTETTINTLKKLFNDLIENMSTDTLEYKKYFVEYHAAAIKHFIDTGYMERLYIADNLYSDAYGLKTLNELDGTASEDDIYNVKTLVQYQYRYNDNVRKLFRIKFRTMIVQALIDNKARHIHKLKKYLRTGPYNVNYHMFKNLFLKPLARHVGKTDIVNHKYLYIVKPSNSKSRFDWLPFMQENYEDNRKTLLPLLQGVVIVAHHKLSYEEKWHDITDYAKLFPNKQPRLVYLATKAKGHKEAAIALFEKLGYKVIDYAKIYDDYLATLPKLTTPKTEKTVTVKEKVEGLPLLSTTLNEYGGFRCNKHLDPTTPRSTVYDYIIKPVQLANGFGQKFFPWGDRQADTIVKHFGSDIGICFNSTQYEKQIKNGKKDGAEYIVEKIKHNILTDPAIRTYVETSVLLANQHSNFNDMLGICSQSVVLTKLFNLPSKNEPVTLAYYNMYMSMNKYIYHYSADTGTWEDCIRDIAKEVNTWTVSQAYVDLNRTLKTSQGIEYLDLSEMSSALLQKKNSPVDYKKMVFIETAIINALKI